MPSCDYPGCNPPIPTETSSTTLVRSQAPDNATSLPFTGGDVAVITLLGVLAIVLGLMALYSSSTWNRLKDRFKP